MEQCHSSTWISLPCLGVNISVVSRGTFINITLGLGRKARRATDHQHSGVAAPRPHDLPVVEPAPPEDQIVLAALQSTLKCLLTMNHIPPARTLPATRSTSQSSFGWWSSGCLHWYWTPDRQRRAWNDGRRW